METTKNKTTINNPHGLDLKNLTEFQAKKETHYTTGEEQTPHFVKDGERLIGQISEQPNIEQPKGVRYWKVKLIQSGKETVLSCNDFQKVGEGNQSAKYRRAILGYSIE